MEFAESEQHRLIREAVRDLAADFDTAYWIDRVRERSFPEEYWNALADGGWLGVAIPEEYGGQGLGMLEMAMVIEELDRGGGQAGVFFTLVPVFGGVSMVEHGSETQKKRYLPALASGEEIFSLGLTEPGAGTNTLQMTTSADMGDDEFVIDGTKTFISGVETATTMLLVARTTEYKPERPTHGLTLFLVEDPAKREGIEYSVLDTQVPWAEKQYQLNIDGLRVPADDAHVLGTVDKGMEVLWATLNTERITTAAGCIGGGLRAIDLAAEYATDREVFDGPIGAYQSVQHPLADAYSKVRAARSILYEAAWRYDEGMDCATEANVAKLRASEAATEAAHHAVQTHGGNGFTREYEVYDIFQRMRLWQTSPVANEMVKNFVAEQVLGLPRSY
jgi:acyl-CoA dehydrogenase